MNYKKAIGGSVAAIITLVISQISAQLLASAFVLLKVPAGICNIIAGILYIGITFMLLKILVEKMFQLKLSDFGIPRFFIKGKWFLTALLLPIVIKGCYLLFIPGEYVSSEMNKEQVFQTLSAGIFFTGIAAGFVEEMVFRGIILHFIEKAWNRNVAIIVPSVLFGFVHILGMDFSVLNCLLVILAGTMVGIMFSMIAIESNSVWNSGIVHAIWNIVIIGGGLSVGEKADAASIMTYVLNTKSFAITGGAFGMESSVIALMGYLIVTMIAFLMMRKAHEKTDHE